MLMQGLSVPSPQLCSTDPLPDPLDLPSLPGSPSVPVHTFLEPEDKTGQAKVRGALATTSGVPYRTDDDTPASAPEITIATTSRTTDWRHRKAGSASGTTRKVYTCKTCGKPMTTSGHTQFRGQRYCPDAPGQISKDEWLAQKRADAKRGKE